MRKHLLLLVIASLLVYSADAQILPDWTWARAISGLQGVQPQAILIDNSENVIVAGTAYIGPLSLDAGSFITDTISEVFLAKFNPAGKLLWKTIISVSDSGYMGSPFIESTKLGADDNIYITFGVYGGEMMQGSGSDTVHILISGKNAKEIALIGTGYMQLPSRAVCKIDDDGNLKYAAVIEGFSQSIVSKGVISGKKANTPKGEGGFGLSINDQKFDGMGNLYLAGSYSIDSIQFGNILIHNIWPEEHSFITKIDSAGNYLWVTIDSATFESGIGGEAISLVIDPSNNPLVFGDFGTSDRKFGTYSIDLAPNVGKKLFLLSLNKSDGSPSRVISFDGDIDDNANLISYDNQAGLYIAGLTNSTSLFGMQVPVSVNQNYSTFLANIDPDGNVSWAKFLNTEIPYISANTISLLFGTDNFPVLSGFFQSKSLLIDGLNADLHDTAANPYTNDVFTAKIDPGLQTAVYLNSYGSSMSDYDFNTFMDKHNMLSIVLPINDTVYFLAQDTLTLNYPASGFILAQFDETGKLLSKKAFAAATDQSYYLTMSNIVTSPSGYFAATGTFYGNTLYLGSKILSSPFDMSTNMFVAKMGYSISGNIFDQSLEKITDGYVKLYVLANSGPAIMVDSSQVNAEGKSYYFDNAPLDGALLYAVADTNVYKNYVPTYSGNSLLWTGATVLDLVTSPAEAFDIQIAQVLPTSGPGIIAGTVSESISDSLINSKGMKSTGRPMKGASVVLIGKSTKGTDPIIAVTTTDELGYYHFTGIPAGDYKIWIDVAGLGMIEYYTVSVSNENPVVDNQNYLVAETGIYKDIEESIKHNNLSNSQIILYPNPAKEYLLISYAKRSRSNGSFTIIDMNGAIVSFFSPDSPANGYAVLNVSGLASGIYLLKADIPGIAPYYARFVKL